MLHRSSNRRTPFFRTLLVTAAMVVAACSDGDAAVLRPVQELPDDVARLVDETWRRFEEVFPARIDCMEPVDLMLVRDVPDGDAAYRVDQRRIEIEIPTSPARFPESLAHELGHHLESTCPEHQALRASFVAAQGLVGEGWFGGDEWDRVPSEHFAESVVLLVNGERLLHDDLILLSPEAVEVVAHWGRGGA